MSFFAALRDARALAPDAKSLTCGIMQTVGPRPYDDDIIKATRINLNLVESILAIAAFYARCIYLLHSRPFIRSFIRSFARSGDWALVQRARSPVWFNNKLVFAWTIMWQTEQRKIIFLCESILIKISCIFIALYDFSFSFFRFCFFGCSRVLSWIEQKFTLQPATNANDDDDDDNKLRIRIYYDICVHEMVSQMEIEGDDRIYICQVPWFKLCSISSWDRERDNGYGVYWRWRSAWVQFIAFSSVWVAFL